MLSDRRLVTSDWRFVLSDRRFTLSDRRVAMSDRRVAMRTSRFAQKNRRWEKEWYISMGGGVEIDGKGWGELQHGNTTRCLRVCTRVTQCARCVLEG